MDLETIVEDKDLALPLDEAAVCDATVVGGMLIERAVELAGRWSRLRPAEKRAILQVLVARITVRSDNVGIRARLGTLPDIVKRAPGHTGVRSGCLADHAVVGSGPAETNLNRDKAIDTRDRPVAS